MHSRILAKSSSVSRWQYSDSSLSSVRLTTDGACLDFLRGSRAAAARSSASSVSMDKSRLPWPAGFTVKLEPGT